MKKIVGITLASILLLLACTYPVDKAINSGDVVNNRGSLSNFDTFETFLQNVDEQKQDEIRIVTYTDEGDAILIDLQNDGNSLIATVDNSRDRYRGDGSKKRTATCSMIQTKYESPLVAYILSDCKGDFTSYNIFNIPEEKLP